MAKRFAGFHLAGGKVTGFANKKDYTAATQGLPENSETIAVASTADLNQFSLTELVQLHNALNKNNQVKGFKNKTAGIEATFPLLAQAAEGAAPAAAAAPATPAKKGATKGGGARGRSSSIAGKSITRNQKENPRRAGTHGAKAWDLITDGMKVEDYSAKVSAAKIPGGLKHLQHDIKRGRVTVA